MQQKLGFFAFEGPCGHRGWTLRWGIGWGCNSAAFTHVHRQDREGSSWCTRSFDGPMARTFTVTGGDWSMRGACFGRTGLLVFLVTSGVHPHRMPATLAVFLCTYVCIAVFISLLLDPTTVKFWVVWWSGHNPLFIGRRSCPCHVCIYLTNEDSNIFAWKSW